MEVGTQMSPETTETDTQTLLMFGVDDHSLLKQLSDGIITLDVLEENNKKAKSMPSESDFAQIIAEKANKLAAE